MIALRLLFFCLGGGIGVVALSAMRSTMARTHSWQDALLVELVFVVISIPCVILINRDIPTEDSTSPLISGYVKDDKLIKDTEHTKYDSIADDKCESTDSPAVGGIVIEDTEVSNLSKACGNYSTFDKEHDEYEKKDNQLAPMTLDTDGSQKVTDTDEQDASLAKLCSHYCSNPLFFLSLLFCGLIVTGMFGPPSLLPSVIIKDRGGSAAQSSQLVMIFGIANIVSRIISGITGEY